MRLKVVLATLLLGGMLTGTAAADPKEKPLKDQAKAERKAVPVPEPSVLLLLTLGLGGLVAIRLLASPIQPQVQPVVSQPIASASSQAAQRQAGKP